MQNQEEIWKDVPNYEGLYQAGNLGNIKSLERMVAGKNNKNYLKKEKILKQFMCRGYLKVTLSKESKLKNFPVHKLVAMAFLNHTPCGYMIVVDHIDNNKLNNKLSNLQVITARENQSKDQKNKSSKYTGVYYSKRINKFISSISINGKQKSLGNFNNEYDAHLAYQKALYDYEKNGVVPFYKTKSSKYVGVNWHKLRKKWTSSIRINYKLIHLGYFDNEEEASTIYQKFKLNLKKTN